MPRGTPPRRPWPWLVLGLAAACAKRGASRDSEAPAADDMASPVSRSLESLEQDLGRLTTELEAADPSPELGEPADAMGTDTTKCERLCAIKGSICELSASICELAGEHPDEPRYAESCSSARAHCERAASICEQRGGDACQS